MKKHPDQSFTNLHRLLDSQDFASEKELQQFLDTLIGQNLDELPQHDLTPSQQAEDMVYNAMDMPPEAARMMIGMALVLDPDCIAAYEALGAFEELPHIAHVFYEKGIALGRAQFGGEFLEKNEGDFWGLHETRPFMRCMAECAECLYDMDRKTQAIHLYREMLELNPNDNQGVRDMLMLYLIEAGDFDGYRKYAEIYAEDALAFAKFNSALAAFKQHGASAEATSLLEAAMAGNKHVSKRLLARNPVEEPPGMYGMGSPEEADLYAHYAWRIWQETPGAIEWLKAHAKKPGGAKRRK